MFHHIVFAPLQIKFFKDKFFLFDETNSSKKEEKGKVIDFLGISKSCNFIRNINWKRNLFHILLFPFLYILGYHIIHSGKLYLKIKFFRGFYAILTTKPEVRLEHWPLDLLYRITSDIKLYYVEKN